MRLSRKYSMKSHAEFSVTRQKGNAKGGKFLVLSTLENKELSHPYAGVIITRKVGNAVTRNKLRRRIHHILSKHLDTIKGNRYIVTIIRWKAPEASFEQLEADWLKQARRLSLLK